jgi:hypothetical protein
VKIYGREAVKGFCGAAGSAIADTIKKLITGG